MNLTWSYSSISCLETCPRQFYTRRVLKIKESSPALEHGNAVHRGVELFLKQGIVTEYIKQRSNVAWNLVESVKAQSIGKRLLVEEKMGLNGLFEPVAFFDDHVWGRAALDAGIIDGSNLMLLDWKTGKIREKATQLAVLSLFVFKHFPEIENITACNIWLEHGKIGEAYKFTRAQEALIWGAIMPKIQAAEAFLSNPPASLPACQCGWCKR